MNKKPKAEVSGADAIKTDKTAIKAETPEADLFSDMYAELDEKSEQEKPKRKRGRPSKKDKFDQEQQKIEMTATLVEPIVSFVSVFLGSRLGEKWKMSKEETKEGAKVTTAVLNRYMPSFEDKAELVAFTMFWSGYVLTRSANSSTNSQQNGKSKNE